MRRHERTPQERTAQEREQARLEREARRAAREGRPPPVEPKPMEVPPPPIPPEPPAYEPPSTPIPAEGPAPEPPVPDHEAEPEVEPRWEGHEVEPAWEDPEPEPEAEPGWEGHEVEPAWEDPEPEPEVDPRREGHEAGPAWEDPEPKPEMDPRSEDQDPEPAVDPGVEDHELGPGVEDHEPEPEVEPEVEDHQAQPEGEERQEEPAQGRRQSPRAEPAEPNGVRPGDPWASDTASGRPPRPRPPAPRGPVPPLQPQRRPQPPPPFQGAARGRGAGSPTNPYRAARGVAAGRAAAARGLLDRRRAARTGTGSRRGGPSSRRLAWLLPLAAIALVALWFLASLFQPFAGEGEGQVRVVIPRGVGAGEIADLLADKGVVSSGFFFHARARLSGRSGDLKPGVFRLREHMSHVAALDVLTQGPPPDVVRITIPEGRARRQAKGIVARQLGGDYLALTRRSSLLDPKRYGAKRARDLEGFLFPATYDLERRASARDLVERQLSTFRREFGKVDLRFAKTRKLTAYDVLVIASMVEGEAQVARERPIIASVIYNRLREGLPLGIDATVRFAVNNWTRPLRRSELEVDSPYNTRERMGLPPGPINSPGLASIRAAAGPARTRFLYFVRKPGTCGEHVFSRTDADRARNEARYKQARARLGGKSPTNC